MGMILRRLRKGAIALLAVFVIVLAYMTQIEPRWLQVQTVDLTLPHLPAAFDGFTLVQISDLHVDSLSDRTLRRMVRWANYQAPDLIALTGDFVTQRDDLERDRPRLEILSALEAKAGRFAVLGNHDYWANPLVVRHILGVAGIEDLSNRVVQIDRDGATIAIAGIDDLMAGDPDLPQVLDALPPDGCAILLVHEPDFADEAAATHRFDLQLAGHSHGGQIRIGPPRILPPYARRYPLGQYQVEAMIAYTNRGIGMTSVPMRLGNRPEITVFHLHAPG
jgi:predicted MPP superfamily phosphohydrolase